MITCPLTAERSCVSDIPFEATVWTVAALLLSCMFADDMRISPPVDTDVTPNDDISVSWRRHEESDQF
jgi:hypothetical protein